MISFPPPTKMLQFGGFPFPCISGNDDLRQEVLLGDLRIQGIHAPPRSLSQLVTTFISSRAEPSPSQVVASIMIFFHTHLCESSGVQKRRFWFLSPPRLPHGAGRSPPLPHDSQGYRGAHLSIQPTDLPYMNGSGSQGCKK